MNENEKVDPIEESMRPETSPAAAGPEKECLKEKETECAETSSPSLAIEAVADSKESEAAPAEETPSAEEGKRFHSMSKQELLDALKEILAADNMEAHREVTAIKQAFFNIKSRENLEELNAFIEAGNQPEAFSSTPDEVENEMKTLYSEFKERRAAFIAADEERRKENLAKKMEIIDKMKEIAGDIDNVNVKFPEFQQLQQDFKAIKDIPAPAETETWKTFQTVVEQFYDHLKMNKELRDLDFKKNLEAKRQLIESAKKLADAPDPVAAFRTLQGLHDEWRNLGPVAKDIRESLWEEFKEASTVVNKRHQEYFEKRKADEQANEEAKTALCEEVEAIDLTKINSFNAWGEATDKVIALQKKWREYGFASKKANTALYARFRKDCDAFFEAKTAYFQKVRDEFSANLEKKTALCEKAEALKGTDDIRQATAEIVKLQAEWKKIGSVPRKQSDAIWQRFTQACNYFFDERKKQNKERRHEENENLEKKRAIIAKLNELPKDGDRSEVIGKVKELQAEWNEIGFVPFKLKDKVFAEYREVCDALYGAYNSRESRARMDNFHARVNSLKGDGQKIDRERDRLVRALDSRRNELQTIENNMGFFSVKSSQGNSMMKEMERKISRLKDDIKEIEQKIAVIDSEEKE